jgi:hypothetical protein
MMLRCANAAAPAYVPSRPESGGKDKAEKNVTDEARSTTKKIDLTKSVNTNILLITNVFRRNVYIATADFHFGERNDGENGNATNDCLIHDSVN